MLAFLWLWAKASRPCAIRSAPSETTPNRKRAPALSDQDQDNVVFLAFDNPNADAVGTITFIGCKNCKNKTFTLVKDDLDKFPMVRCAACGSNIGRMGWAD